MKDKIIRVACAVIQDEGKVLTAQRSETMSMPLKWEFPGGKIHEGESAEECLARELDEELGIMVRVENSLPPVFHEYEEFAVELIPFVCKLTGGRLRLNEHRAIAWLSPHQLDGMDWPAADITVIASYIASLARKAGL